MTTVKGPALTPALAFTLCSNGVWVTNGGYTFRNVGKWGQYCARGVYPECIRGCRKHTKYSMMMPDWMTTWHIATINR